MTESFLNLILGLLDLISSLTAINWKKSPDAEPINFNNFSIFTKLTINCFIGFILTTIVFWVGHSYKTPSLALILLFFLVNIALNIRKTNIIKSFFISLVHTFAFSIGASLMMFAYIQSIHAP